MSKENQNIEWKLVWKDEYLKWICGFANANGGTLVIGKSDEGEIRGVHNARKLLEDLPNKISNILGITADVNIISENQKDYIEIITEAYSAPISYKGHFYYRSGSTVQDLKGTDLEKLLLAKIGRKWDGVEAQGFGLDDISLEAIDIFRRQALRSQRIPADDLNEKGPRLIESLGLTTQHGVKRAAIIAFGKDPEKLVTGAYVKIGYFKTHIDLLYQDEIHGSLISQIEKTMDLLLTKYMKANISYTGLSRIETFDYPETAMREALLNALVHKDYSSAIPLQISVYQDWLMIYNPGNLPLGWTIDTLKEKHTSRPPNPDIANALFRAGYIEIWGRGTLSIVNQCLEAGLPEPKFVDKWGGIAVVFRQKKVAKTEREGSGMASGRSSGMTSVKILELIAADKRITIPELARNIGISTRAIERQLAQLQQSKALKRIGSNVSGHWNILTNKTDDPIRISPCLDSEKGSGIGSGISSGIGSGMTSVKIMEHITAEKHITIPELARKIGISTRAVEKHLSRLKHKGNLKRVGPSRGGHWEIVAGGNNH